MKTKAAPFLFLVVFLVTACASAPGVDPNGKALNAGYQIDMQWLSQPVDHDDPAGAVFDQEVTILMPDHAVTDSPVFFILGNEGDYTREGLIRLYEAYGHPKDVIFLQIEHRGYGQSLSNDEDQSIPRYVTVDQALADYHRAVGTLKKRFTGPWMAAGYSYGGGLVVNYAYRYPEDVEVILASSAVIHWPFFMPEYDRQMRKNLGEDLYRSIAAHVQRLQPERLFDETWQQREYIIWLSLGLSQYGQYQTLHPIVKGLSRLPTPLFVRALKWMDALAAGGKGWAIAESLVKQTLTRQEAMTGKDNWRTWKYQQCYETGTFWVSDPPGGVFPRSNEEIVMECRAMFGENPPAATAPPWNPAAMVKNLTVPQIHVIGGKDPWKELCLPPDHGIPGVTYIYAENGFHCPDRGDPELGQRVMTALRSHVSR